MAPDRDYVIDIAPEFSSEDTARINRFIGRAAPFIDRNKWGDKADLAHALMTAHLLTISAQQGKTQVTSEKVGDLARTFSTSNEGLGSTGYGAELKRMKRTILVTPIVAT